MKKFVLLVVYCILLSQFSFAQTQDSTAQQADTATAVAPVVPVQKDTSVRKAPVARKKVDSAAQANRPVIADTLRPAAKDTVVALQPLHLDSVPAENTLAAFQAALRDHPYYNLRFKGASRELFLKETEGTGTDGIFYFLFGLLFYYAIIKIFFPKYLDNITTLFFRVTMRHQQLREQLSQTPLPSLFLNILFVSTGGMFLAFAARYYNYMPGQNLWLVWAYGCLVVMAIYLGKFIILKIVGWIFNVSNATDTYIFIIFMVNKMVGIFLVPVLILMAFPYGSWLPVVMTLAFILLALALVYRFIISYKPIRSEIKVSRFHFFMYLCAFEVAPLLLIYKVLLKFVERSY